jgi:hypothetical protein
MEADLTRRTPNTVGTSSYPPPQHHRLGWEEVPASNTRPFDAKDLPGLVHFNRARQELELATTIDEVKAIRDKAEAMRVYAQQVTCSLEMQNMLAEIKLRAERKLGEMLRDSGISQRKEHNLLRGRIVRLRENSPSLEELGISKSQSSRCQLISSIGEEQFEERVSRIKESGKELTSKELVTFAKTLQRVEARAEKRNKSMERAEKVHPDERIRILHGDFREVLGEAVVPSSTVDLLLTDPPYAENYLPLWGELGAFAARVLKPGKLLASYAGNYHLLEAMNLLALHLNYVWTLAVVYPGSPDTVFARRIKTYWKPVVLFSNGEYRPEEKLEWLHDRIQGHGRSKAHDDWEQGLGESEYLIKALTYEGGLVVDPFLGSGTTGVASKRLKRRFVGCDSNEASVQMALSRLRDES